MSLAFLIVKTLSHTLGKSIKLSILIYSINSNVLLSSLVWKHRKKLLVRTVTVFTSWGYCGDNMNLGMKNVLSTGKFDSNVVNTANDHF